MTAEMISQLINLNNCNNRFFMQKGPKTPWSQPLKSKDVQEYTNSKVAIYYLSDISCSLGVRAFPTVFIS